MVKKKIGLIYSYNKEWVAGSYYILNLIHSLHLLEDQRKPELIILSHSIEEFKSIQQTGYPYLKFHLLYKKKNSFLRGVCNRALTKMGHLFGKEWNFFKELPEEKLSIPLDLLFPALNIDYFSAVENKLFWIPDFQEHFLPRFFSEDELLNRKRYQLSLLAEKNAIVFSSNDAMSHFKEIYPQAACKTFVLPFAVTHPRYDHIKIEDLRDKYGLQKKYFFCANQFWAHKNHLTVFKAIKLLKEEGIPDLQVVFSGKETDYRNPEFFEELKKIVSQAGVEQQCAFLGFIDREDQLQLMQHAICVIQPSFFEGWSTVVEDVKAMNQYIILSDLKVHREQLSENVSFFNPESERELADHMKQILHHAPVNIQLNYQKQIHSFGKKFIDIVEKLKV
jgi:glycosyltransferase involved in cell wall biosynthesis